MIPAAHPVLCQLKGCKDPASVAVKLHIPAKGYAIDAHTPITVICGVTLCPAHGVTVKASEFINDDIRKALKWLCRATHRADPDIERAFASTISIESEEYLNFCATAHDRQPPQVGHA